MANNTPKLDISTFDPEKIQSFIGKKGTADVSIGVPSGQTTPQVGIGSTDAKLPSIAQDIAAPVAPVATRPITPVAPAPEVAPVSKEQIRTNITSSFGKAGTQGIANAAAVRGLLKFSDQPVTEERVSELTGMRLGDLVEQINPALAEQIPGFMVRAEEVATEVTPTGVRERVTTEAVEAPEAPKSASEQLKSLLTTLPTVRGEARERAVQDVGLAAKSQAISTAQTAANEALGKVNRLKRGIQAAGIEDIREEDVILGKPLLKSTINNQIKELGREQKLDQMLANIEVGTAIDEYNTRLAETQIAQGNFDRAEAIVRETADEAFQGAELQIQALEAINQIDEVQAASLRNDLEKERELQLNGFVPLTTSLQEAQLEFGREGVFQDPITGKIYKKPEPGPSELELFAAKKQVEEMFNQGKMTELELFEAKKEIDERFKLRAEERKVGPGGVKTTRAQQEAASFGLRIQDSNEIMNRLFDTTDIVEKITGRLSVARNVPNRLKSPELRELEQAEANFINAILRRESGAAISDSEFERAAQQYFPQPGDSAGTLVNKKANRERILNNLQREAGAAFPEEEISFSSFYDSLPASKRREVDQLQLELGIDESELFEVLQEQLSFNSVGSDTKQASGNRPQRNNNPGNVKRGGIGDRFAKKGPDGKPLTDEVGHLIFPNPEAGFNALKQDVKAKITGRSRVVKSPNPTIAEVGRAFAEDPNWARGVARLIGTDVNTKARSVDFNKLINAIATQEGFFA